MSSPIPADSEDPTGIVRTLFLGRVAGHSGFEKRGTVAKGQNFSYRAGGLRDLLSIAGYSGLMECGTGQPDNDTFGADAARLTQNVRRRPIRLMEVHHA
jgi:hypothetical protein